MKNNSAPVCKVEIVDKVKVKKTQANLPEKGDIFSMAETFKLLGGPTRLKIILALIENELCVCDLSVVSKNSVSAVSHQLRLLRNFRLIKYRKEGKMVYYSINDKHIKNLVNQLKKHIEE